MNVRTATDFALQVNPSYVSTVQGGTASYTVSASSDATVAGGISLSMEDLPAGITVDFNPPTIQVGETSTLTLTASATLATGTYDLTLSGTGGGLVRTVPAQLAVGSSAKPILNTISPSSFVSGGRTRVTVTGQNLAGSTVSIPTDQPDPSDPVSRIFPTAQLVSINAAGTSMEVDIDATDTRILDFYNLMVDNGQGREVIQFRVLPPGPLVDAWTPAEPQQGGLYALSISGRHLAGTTLSPSASGRVLLHSVESSEEEISALLEVLPNAPLGQINLVVADGQGRQVLVPITITAPNKASRSSYNLLDRRDGAKVASARPMPAVYFQEFAVRDAETTEMVDETLRIQAFDPETQLSRRSISFELYIHVTIPLIHAQWQKVILFDPITGVIGTAVLQGLGIGQKVPISAFVLSAYFQMDLTIYFSITNTGFTFPRFCIEITYGAEITGFDGFAYSASFCRGGGFHAFGTGSVSSGEMTGGSCASVTPLGLGDGILDGEVQQNACCSQPIRVAMSGHSFTGLPWGRSFALDTPSAGSTTSNEQNCTCPCGAAIDGTLLRPGGSTQGNFEVQNLGSGSCDYQYEVRQASGQTQMN
ncbi:MAG TPA: hypothetical protein PK413_12780, partial [Thermoanaerobaculia bacterium]|nr:hypothetical protein [Thermoanaerobaculia bacterium]